jgi:hypothetical protein
MIARMLSLSLTRALAPCWAAFYQSAPQKMSAVTMRQKVAGERDDQTIERSRARKLLGVSTATLTTQLFKRGLRNTFVQGARPLNPDAPPMVGPPTRCATFRRARTSTRSTCSPTARIRSAPRWRPFRPAACW